LQELMTTLTDPAKELVEVCELLAVTGRGRGDEFLASKFAVEAWSLEFYRIIFCIIDRIEHVREIIQHIGLDDDTINDAGAHLDQIKSAFNKESAVNEWNSTGLKAVSRANSSPIKMLSKSIRDIESYPKLSDKEAVELLELCSDLIEWLKENSVASHDFIRISLISGLEQFRFRLSKLRWVGWSYTAQSLREVVGACMALDRGMPENRLLAPDAEAVLAKTKALLGRVFEIVGVARETTDRVEFLVRAYGYASSLGGPAAAAAIALLTHTTQQP